MRECGVRVCTWSRRRARTLGSDAASMGDGAFTLLECEAEHWYAIGICMLVVECAAVFGEFAGRPG